MILTSNIDLTEFCNQLGALRGQAVRASQLPAVAQPAFESFLVGRTLIQLAEGADTDTEGYLLPADYEEFYSELMYRSGLPYAVQWPGFPWPM